MVNVIEFALKETCFVFQETDLIEFLGLNMFAPSQLSIQDAMSMMSSKESESLSGKDLPKLLLYHLMKNNYRWRDKVQKHIPNTCEAGIEEQNKLAPGNQANLPSDNDYDSFLNELELSSDTESRPVIHPNDILLHTIIRCNLELKQVLFQKLLMCKQSVPLVYRIPGNDTPFYSLFPLRSMSIVCKTKEGANVLCAATMKSKVVAFVRIGNSRQSKSKLINDILSEQKHATFCHRDVVDENTKPLNAKGLIEAAWFLPSGKPSDPFEEVITFLNLRGDAAYLPNEIGITGKIASAVVTVIDTSCLGNEKAIASIRTLSKWSGQIIVLLTNNLGGVSTENVKSHFRKCFPNPSGKIKFLQTFNWNTNNLKSEVTLRKELLSLLQPVIQGEKGSSLSKCGKMLSQENRVILDEATDDQAEGKSSAKLIFSGLCSSEDAKWFVESDIDDLPTVMSKEEHLPLQGKLWNKWSDLNKKQHKNKGGSSIQDIGDIQKQMDDIKQKQAQKCSQLSQSMNSFIKSLIKANDSNGGYPNFLLWLKLILNENSRKVLPGLFKEFCQAWVKVREAKDTNANGDQIKMLQEVAEQAEIKLATASFGLEHFMRELGQLYESSVPSKQPVCGNILTQKLPSVMADLLIKGQAFEIMDGDASNIAINWVKEVLRQLEAKIGNKKLFIVSVLGIQSSGKSTLLNAIFGLQFTVSAGRCTRGVFGQLVPVDKRKELPYDYILVVDTEGLKAPELGQSHLDHDNELATFVIGIGDVTLINIKGENTAEIKDVLQITVQAFLRMKLANDKIELKRKCIFLHQNVGAVNAEEQMMQGLKKFQENLDMMTKNAAEEENMRHIQSFREVIDFQGEKHVLYFPDLWLGDPPMAPSNPGYSMKVMEVLQRLEHIAVSGSALTNINGLKHRIEDLWNGIMAENFVFSFKNTLEIKTYNSMESMYQHLSGEYRRCLMEWFEKKASIEIELCKDADTLKKCCKDLKRGLQVDFVQHKTEIEKQLIEYFDNNEMDYILIQWKNSRVVKFRNMAEEVERNTLRYIEQKQEEHRIALISKSTDMKLEGDIYARAQDLAKAYRGKTVETRELKCTFDKVWMKWTAEFIQNKSECIQPGMIENMLIDNLLQRLNKNRALVIKELSDDRERPRLKQLNIPRLENSWTANDINVEHINKPSSFAKGMTNFLFGKGRASIEKLKRQAKDYTDNVFRKMDVEFENLLTKDVQIRNEHAREIVNKVVYCFESENNKPDHKLTFQTPYEVKLVVYVCSYAYTKFTFMADRYEKAHGIKGKLEAYKNAAQRLFLNTVQEKSHEFVAADLLCDRVKNKIIDTIKAAIPRQIAEEILNEFVHYKHNVMLRVLDNLARKKDFSAFMLYIRDSKSFVNNWLKNFINEAIFNTKDASVSRYLAIASSRLSNIMKCTKEAIIEVTKEKKKSKRGNWAQLFEANMKKELAVPSDLLDPITKNILDVENFKNVLLEKLADLENDVVQEFQCCDADQIVWKGTPPIETVMKEIWGCPEQCPFCSEPCQRNEGHISDGVKHSCIQHRPYGVGGIVGENDDELRIVTCNFAVQSSAKFKCTVIDLKCRESGKCETSGVNYTHHPYKQYKSYLPNWDIDPNPTMEVSKYWMWFVGKNIDNLCSIYGAKKPKIPESWMAITDEDALDSLRIPKK